MSNQKLTLREVTEKVLQDDSNKKDMLISVNRLIMGSTGEVGFRTSKGCTTLSKMQDFERLAFNDYALSQMFTKLGIDVRFGKKNMEEAPKLIAPIFNHWANKLDSRTLLRIRDSKDGTGIIRGVLSDSYTKLDNRLVVQALEQITRKIPENEVISYHMDDRRFHVRLAFPALSHTVGKDSRGVGDVVQVGADIVNSEVGNSSLGVSGMIYRLVCTNGMKRAEGQGDAFSQRHIHLNPNELYNRMSTAMGKAIQQGDVMIDEIKKAREVKVDHPMRIIEELAKQEKYSQELTDKLKTSFSIEPDKNVWGITNCITRTAQILPNEKRLAMERFAGELIFDRNKILKIDFKGDVLS